MKDRLMDMDMEQWSIIQDSGSGCNDLKRACGVNCLGGENNGSVNMSVEGRSDKTVSSDGLISWGKNR